MNFGHTIGHAIEASSDYLHGECVGLGMLYFVDDKIKDRFVNILTKYNLPTNVKINKNKLLDLIVHDKKASGDDIDIILVNKIGSYEIRKVKVNDLINYM